MVRIGRKQGLVIGRPAPRCLSHLTEGTASRWWVRQAKAAKGASGDEHRVTENDGERRS